MPAIATAGWQDVRPTVAAIQILLPPTFGEKVYASRHTFGAPLPEGWTDSQSWDTADRNTGASLGWSMPGGRLLAARGSLDVSECNDSIGDVPVQIQTHRDPEAKQDGWVKSDRFFINAKLDLSSTRSVIFSGGADTPAGIDTLIAALRSIRRASPR